MGMCAGSVGVAKTQPTAIATTPTWLTADAATKRKRFHVWLSSAVRNEGEGKGGRVP